MKCFFLKALSFHVSVKKGSKGSGSCSTPNTSLPWLHYTTVTSLEVLYLFLKACSGGWMTSVGNLGLFGFFDVWVFLCNLYLHRRCGWAVYFLHLCKSTAWIQFPSLLFLGQTPPRLLRISADKDFFRWPTVSWNLVLKTRSGLPPEIFSEWHIEERFLFCTP